MNVQVLGISSDSTFALKGGRRVKDAAWKPVPSAHTPVTLRVRWPVEWGYVINIRLLSGVIDPSVKERFAYNGFKYRVLQQVNMPIRGRFRVDNI